MQKQGNVAGWEGTGTQDELEDEHLRGTQGCRQQNTCWRAVSCFFLLLAGSTAASLWRPLSHGLYEAVGTGCPYWPI